MVQCPQFLAQVVAARGVRRLLKLFWMFARHGVERAMHLNVPIRMLVIV